MGYWMRRPVIAGNWKMHGSLAQVKLWCQGMSEALAAQPTGDMDWFLFPPAIYVQSVQHHLLGSPVAWGLQHASPELGEGAFTGELSLSMAAELGCSAVLVGHSERRQLYSMTDQDVAKLVASSLKSNYIPVVCVGETLKQREKGLTLQIIQEQLAVVLSLHDNPDALSRIIIAYEPVWAIGTGKTAQPEQAEEVHSFIRSCLASKSDSLAEQVRVIYGGSVKPNNAAELLSMPNIDGALVGGASLDFEKFLEIGKPCSF
jgi:triosephosphate isomerase (TIM)